MDTAGAKALGQDNVGGTARRPVWPEQSERWGEQSKGRGERAGAGRAGPTSHKEDSSFYPEGGVSPGGLWAEEGQSSCNF